MKIKIKKSNEGKFTEAAKRAGESVQEHARNVLNNPKATKLQKKRAQFAVNAKKWKHEEGGSIHKPFGHRSNLDNAWIPTKELKKNYPCVSFQTGGKSLSEKASDAYEDFNNSGWGTAYDLLNLGLYAAAPFTGGATLIPAMAMSVGQGIAGANNMYQKGATVNNVADVVGGVLAAPGKAVAKPIMKAVGKTAKYVKRAPLVTKNLYTEPLWKMAANDAKYLPYATYIYTNTGNNVFQVGNDLVDNYSTQVAPYLDLSRQINTQVKDANKRAGTR